MIFQAIFLYAFAVQAGWTSYSSDSWIYYHVFDDQLLNSPLRKYFQRVCVDFSDIPIMFLGDQNVTYIEIQGENFPRWPYNSEGPPPPFTHSKRHICSTIVSFEHETDKMSILPNFQIIPKSANTFKFAHSLFLLILMYFLINLIFKTTGPSSKLKDRTHTMKKQLSDTALILIKAYVEKEGIVPTIHEIVHSYLNQAFYLDENNFSPICPQPFQFALSLPEGTTFPTLFKPPIVQLAFDSSVFNIVPETYDFSQDRYTTMIECSGESFVGVVPRHPLGVYMEICSPTIYFSLNPVN